MIIIAPDAITTINNKTTEVFLNDSLSKNAGDLGLSFKTIKINYYQ